MVGRDTPEPRRSWTLCKTSQAQATVDESRSLNLMCQKTVRLVVFVQMCQNRLIIKNNY